MSERGLNDTSFERTFCDHWIDHPNDRWGGCYCKLLAGHEGEHSAQYPPSVTVGADDQHTPRGQRER